MDGVVTRRIIAASAANLAPAPGLFQRHQVDQSQVSTRQHRHQVLASQCLARQPLFPLRHLLVQSRKTAHAAPAMGTLSVVAGSKVAVAQCMGTAATLQVIAAMAVNLDLALGLLEFKLLVRARRLLIQTLGNSLWLVTLAFLPCMLL